MGDFDSSDDDNVENLPPLPHDQFRIDWLNLPRLGLHNTLALSALPGCRFREQRRNLEEDVEVIAKTGITDVMVLMQAAEFRKYRVPGLLEEYSKQGLEVHHISMEDGCVPGFSVLLEAVFRVQEVVGVGGRLLVHCYGGLGRTCLVVACYLLGLDSTLAPEAVIAILRSLRGPRAVQTVRQYNMIMEYRGLLGREELPRDSRSRSVSR